MAHLILSRQQARRVVTPRNGSLLRGVKPIIKPDTAKWIIRYTFYAFIFSLPFEESYVAAGMTLPKLFGVALAAFALLQPRLCYEFPPRAFWWFAIYVCIVAVWGSYLIVFPSDVPDFTKSFIRLVLRLVQLLILFWISYNLMRQERVVNGTLWALAGANIILALLQILGITGDISADGRMSAFDANPNGLAAVLSLGLLALLGLGYGRGKHDWKGRLFFWLGSGIIAVAMVQTGSRGAVVAVAASLSVFFLRGKSLATKLKFGVITFAGIITLAVASYRIDAVRVRWEKTFYDESLAGREKIYPTAIGMILESPLVGWGPVNHRWELGPRLGDQARDEHNVYLFVLAEVGLMGAFPFFIGLWLCCRAAWNARHSVQGILPLVMLLFMLTASMKGTYISNKYYWVILSYALASGYAIRPQRSKMAILSQYPSSGGMGRKSEVVAVSATGRPRRLSRSF